MLYLLRCIYGHNSKVWNLSSASAHVAWGTSKPDISYFCSVEYEWENALIVKLESIVLVLYIHPQQLIFALL